jgi:hypothetical protein
MCANNRKQKVEGRIQDFDAVSLYPSAMWSMEGIPKGRPKLIETDTDLWAASVTSFFVEINITKLIPKGPVPYAFGQVFTKSGGTKMFCNKAVRQFYTDKRGLADLMEFYEIEYEVIRGYYFNEGFNPKIRTFIKKLFDLRVSYKQQGNPLEKTIKLLLNSIYGKSILKSIPTEIKVVKKSELDKILIRYYNYIESINGSAKMDKVYCKIIKPINHHFNLPQFGATVLSWSKHLMNRVMCLAEQNEIPIYYQDTDSMHLREPDVAILAKLFKQRYGQTLIGSGLTQFHSDFETPANCVGPVPSKLLIALGKKSYLDVLADEEGHIGYHIRMKGVPQQVILNYCKKMEIDLVELYEVLYEGLSVKFDLTDGSPCFRKTKNYEQVTLEKFYRRVRF